MQTENLYFPDDIGKIDPSPFDKGWIAEQFTEHRQRLVQVVRFRLDRRLHGRVDPEDILQEAYLDAVKRARHFHDRMSVFVQIRQILLQTLTDVHRRHLAVKARNVSREVSLNQANHSQSSIAITRLLQARISSPSSPIKQAETLFKLNQAIESLSDNDCEVLLMRHFEDMTNLEVAQALNIKPDTACRRYLRALERLKGILESLSHFRD